MELLGCSRPTARKLLKILAILGLGEIDDPGGSSPTSLKLGEEFEWMLADEMKGMLGLEEGAPF